MGYYTHYRLQWTGEQSTTKPCEHCNGKGYITQTDPVEEFVNTAPFTYGNTQPISTNLSDAVKWYDHEADLKRLSLQFPDVLFKLSGEGEESGDIWVKYFKNGKMQTAKAEIKVAEFNESQLQ